jgi:hypothetical protein
MHGDHANERRLDYEDLIIYQAAMPAMENADAPPQPASGGPYRGKIVSFLDQMIAVRTDGRAGSAPLYYVWLSDIVGVE